LKPKRILELGSGFNSFVFRYYISNRNQDTTIFTIDDSQEWLDKTGKFLVANNLPNKNLIPWDLFSKQDHGTFDFIFYDFGSMEVRKNTLKDVLALLKQDGVILLDDVHKLDYQSYAKKLLKENGFKCYNLKSFTIDRFGRYALLATKVRNEKAGSIEFNGS
jgi:predicted O-methyltransferase YrrM